MKRKAMYYSNLYCTKCGLKMVIPRPQARKRKEGHIKTMFCARCQSKTDFKETYKEVQYV